jgi:hypothetical protein
MARAYSTRPSTLINLPPDEWEALGVDTCCYMAGLAERTAAESALIEEWIASGKGMIPPLIITREARAV